MTPSLQIGVIGMGRTGPAIASALRANGHHIVAVSAHSGASADRADVMLPGVPLAEPQDVVAGVELVVLAVPDSQIRGLAEELPWRPGQVVAHLSGAVGLDVFSTPAQVGAMTMVLHPAMTFTGTSLDVQRLQGCPMAITASPLVKPLAELVAREIGCVPVNLAAEDKPRYHAALTHASNHLVTLISQSRTLLAEAGIKDPGSYLRPLTMAALEGALEQGIDALTGPVKRGDDATVGAHVEALGDTEAGRTYRCLSEATRAAVSLQGDPLQTEEL